MHDGGHLLVNALRAAGNNSDGIVMPQSGLRGDPVQRIQNNRPDVQGLPRGVD